jgi:hypothetical protein
VRKQHINKVEDIVLYNCYMITMIGSEINCGINSETKDNIRSDEVFMKYLRIF